ncbi:MAG: putative Ig domain-containing protein [Gammaproteobacteria bacterium]
MRTGNRFGRLLSLVCWSLVLAACGGDENAADPEGIQDGGPKQPAPEPSTNHAPTISGTPATSVVVGSTYRFTPKADDADGDVLSFGVRNKPSWANFDVSSGVLSGRPNDADLGTYSNIVIEVTDGEATARLPAFSITVEATGNGSATLTWTAPTERTDGSPLTNLAGYKLYWGHESRKYTESVDIDNPGVTTYVVDNLAPGTYYFATTAVSADGLESDYSNEASKTIRP